MATHKSSLHNRPEVESQIPIILRNETDNSRKRKKFSNSLILDIKEEGKKKKFSNSLILDIKEEGNKNNSQILKFLTEKIHRTLKYKIYEKEIIFIARAAANRSDGRMG